MNINMNMNNVIKLRIKTQNHSFSTSAVNYIDFRQKETDPGRIMELIKEFDKHNPRPTYNKSEGIIGEKNSMPFAWAHHHKRCDYVNEKLIESGVNFDWGTVEGVVDRLTDKEGSPFHGDRVGIAIDDTTSGIAKKDTSSGIAKNDTSSDIEKKDIVSGIAKNDTPSGITKGKECENNSTTEESSSVKYDNKKLSPLDYVLEKESTEMPSFYESDGGE